MVGVPSGQFAVNDRPDMDWFHATGCGLLAAVLFVLAIVLDSSSLDSIGLNVSLCIGGGIALLAVAVLFGTHAVAEQRKQQQQQGRHDRGLAG
ncbi:hypothetical protein [Amycolatopsis cihanbeyliensis]|uniref:Uncharacterized protein n=1 Tax=Amycolatopsis cihanbeyliensis TaxID=1128664 RepID=A0A542DQW3_AMYCI|nr:hypothetical protein [Amycolatopsis cihanbeyliensis]TQJ05491.1 hypothetical protein FB471_5325 [Amycolatopsis cihanbeyliensis]